MLTRGGRRSAAMRARVRPRRAWWHDLRGPGRDLRRAGGVSGAAVLMLALGMAGTIVMFAVVQGVLLRPLPVRDDEREIVAWKQFPTGARAHWPFRSSELEALGRESRLLERVAGISQAAPRRRPRAGTQ
jgi:putative ABC transport system permease protein